MKRSRNARSGHLSKRPSAPRAGTTPRPGGPSPMFAGNLRSQDWVSIPPPLCNPATVLLGRSLSLEILAVEIFVDGCLRESAKALGHRRKVRKSPKRDRRSKGVLRVLRGSGLEWLQRAASDGYESRPAIGRTRPCHRREHRRSRARRTDGIGLSGNHQMAPQLSRKRGP
jgi:hypothetical protein